MSEHRTYVEVILPVPVNHGFTYSVDTTTAFSGDSAQPVAGQRVLVPFGSRMLVGIIVRVGSEKPSYVTKSVKQVIDSYPCMSPQLIELLLWAANYYFHPLGDVFKQFMPHRDIKLEVNKYYKLTSQDINNVAISQQEQEIVAYMRHRKSVTKNTLFGKFGQGRVNRLVQQGIIEVGFKEQDQIPDISKSDDSHDRPAGAVQEPEGIQLTDEQKQTIDILVTNLQTNTFNTTLIMGVTGSGKTEIYMRVIAKALEQGKSAIVLVPEIALTPQLVNRFTSRFGSIVGVIHSKIKTSSLKKTYRDILQDKIRIVIGVRSAVFAPLKRAGVIVVDEEHEHTYKQDDRFRYHARDVAIMRGKLDHSLVILGSATPSLESYANAETGKYQFSKLTRRIHDLPMPDIHVIDLKKEHPHRIGNEILTKPVVEALAETFSHNKQAIIMLNRRGYSSGLICGDCGYVAKCPFCDITLTYHKTLQRMLCHYCGYTAPVFTKCTACGSPNIRSTGIGTQRLEEEIKKTFNAVKFIRMDRDTTADPGSHEQMIDRFGSGDIPILLGTQMVSKGLDFPDVEMVCLPLLDIGLNVPDFRVSERVFNIIMQSAGRAGRAHSGARVFIQTYNPDYYPIRYAVEYNTEKFYKEELIYRKELSYPPYSRIALVLFKHKNLALLQRAMQSLEQILNQGAIIPETISVFGPVPSPVAKVRGYYFYNLMLKSLKTNQLHDTLRQLDQTFQKLIPGIQCSIDMDPQRFV